MHDLISRLTQSLQPYLSQVRAWHIAYSGGMDSHVLLHCLANMRDRIEPPPIKAIHINHGLSEHANDWASHCQSVCDQLAIPLLVINVDAQPGAGQSPEQAARDARYQALVKVLPENACLLTAHHRRDQAETLVLQLLRGGGVQGTAAMPHCGKLAAGLHLRPLLDCNHEQLLAYADAHQLDWVDDDSNENTRFDRNYLRHQVMPVIRQRWPALDVTLARVARRHAETADLLSDLAATDLAEVQTGKADCLDRTALGNLTTARQRNLIRYWLAQQQLTVPGHARLDEVLRQVHHARVETMPCVTWPGGEIRRYRNGIYAMRPLRPFDQQHTLDWPDQDRVECPTRQGFFERRLEPGSGIRATVWQNARVSVRYRCGGETCQTEARGHQRSLKNLFQEWGVPPWLRNRIPLLYVDEDLAAIIGYKICANYTASADQQGYQLCWQGQSD